LFPFILLVFIFYFLFFLKKNYSGLRIQPTVHRLSRAATSSGHFLLHRAAYSTPPLPTLQQPTITVHWRGPLPPAATSQIQPQYQPFSIFLFADSRLSSTIPVEKLCQMFQVVFLYGLVRARHY
jgi:hypothetical protein